MHWLRSSIYRIGTICLISFFVFCSTASFNQGWAAPPAAWKPSKPLTIILSSYGGAYEWIARQLSRVLPDYLGQKVIVQGVTGAEGRNALDMLQRAKPDGRTISLLGVGTYVSAAVTRHYSWDVRDLSVIVTIDTPPYAIFVSPTSPFMSYDDLVKMKKVVRVAASPANFAIIPLLVHFDKKGIQYRVARFQGSAASALAVLAGNADLTISALSRENTDRIKSGDYRTLWIYDNKRFPLIPNVPTHIDLGMPKEWANFRSCRPIQVSPHTPEQIQRGLKAALIKALQDKRTIEWSKKFDTPMDALPEAEYTERIRFLIKSFNENMQIVENYF